MPRLPAGAWVVVLDGAKALTFVNEAEGAKPRLRVLDKEVLDEGGGLAVPADPTAPAPSGTESDAHRLDEHRFVGDLADRLYKAAHRGAFEDLVLVAGPQHLGTLRPRLHKEVAARVVAEVPKTLTGHPVDQIERILAADLAGG